MLGRFSSHLASLKDVRIPFGYWRASEGWSDVKTRVFFGLFCVGVVLPAIASISGVLIGGGNGFMQARRAKLNRIETTQAVLDEAGNEGTKRASIASRISAILYVMPELLGILATRMMKGEALQTFVKGMGAV